MNRIWFRIGLHRNNTPRLEEVVATLGNTAIFVDASFTPHRHYFNVRLTHEELTLVRLAVELTTVMEIELYGK